MNKAALDLTILEQRIGNFEYTSLQAFVDDFETMIEDCVTIFGEASLEAR